VTQHRHGLHAIAGPDAVELKAPVDLEGRDLTTVADFNVSAGQTVPFVLTWYPSHWTSPPHRHGEELLDKTEAWWGDWSAKCKLGGRWRSAVHRSLVTLKALTYSPTGGIVGAATTSLPERIGGIRNWDYRYCWLRDATFALYALMASNYGFEAQDWSRWLIRAAAGEPSNLQIMYGLAGERRLDEYEIPWLGGFRASAPVRVGNVAYTQRQMDIYGEVMDAFHNARVHGFELGPETWQVQLKLMEFLAGHWRDPESGLWEMRGPKHRHTHSRVMAWVAFDRAIKAVERFGLEGPVDQWRKLRRAIHDDVCRNGYNAKRNAFVQFYGADLLDASLLLMPLVGFLPPRDPRVMGTVKAIQNELTVKGLVYRYQTSARVDALPPGEGAFLACSFWLADVLAMMGRRKEAERLFTKLIALRNDVGLLAEEYDPVARRQLGNFPQAFSHVGLINTAQNLRQKRGPAEKRAKN
jgi:GH15 family glucan-1,4-alpha-glucosidase